MGWFTIPRVQSTLPFNFSIWFELHYSVNIALREVLDIRGSMLVIGNNILGKDNLPFNDLTKDNQDISMQYIDIDGDSSTFSSSSADLLLSAHEDGSATTCYRVAKH